MEHSTEYMNYILTEYTRKWNNRECRSFGGAAQDFFVRKCLKDKTNGTYLEIGSNHPILVNNTFILEYAFGWTGFMVEYLEEYRNHYKNIRPKSYHLIADATKINWKNELEKVSFPKNIDYLQIDLDVNNRSTLDCLENLDSQIFDEYKFATITFEHDIYTGNYYNTRNLSREIFKKRGYVCVFPDVIAGSQFGEFEDWYVHPDLVDISFINKIKRDTPQKYEDIIKIIDTETGGSL
jgi:hypothetical protein